MKNKIDVRGISQQQALTQLEKALEDQSLKTVEILSSEQDSTSALINYLAIKVSPLKKSCKHLKGKLLLPTSVASR